MILVGLHPSVNPVSPYPENCCTFLNFHIYSRYTSSLSLAKTVVAAYSKHRARGKATETNKLNA